MSHRSPTTSSSTSSSLSWAWEKEKPKPGANQQAEQLLQTELEHWTAPAEAGGAVSIREGQLMPKQEQAEPFPTTLME